MLYKEGLEQIRAVFYYLTNEHQPIAMVNFYLAFLKVVIIAIVCLAPVIDCETSLTCGI
jgi:hypothetical protein